MEKRTKKIIKATPRELKLRLSDSDVKALAKTAAIAELSIEELLEGFIGDLTDGTYCHGSDERAQALSWFDCCGFERLNRTSFLHFLLSGSFMDEFVDAWKNFRKCIEKIKDTEKALKELKDENNPNPLGEKEYKKYLEWEIRDYEKEKASYANTVETHWNAYLEWTDAASPDREKETGAALAWAAKYGADG